MGQKLRVVAVAGAVFALVSHANAAFYGAPRFSKSERIVLQGPTLAPLGHTRFCLQYPHECRVQRPQFGKRGTVLGQKRWAELVKVNETVNASIAPQANTEGLVGEEWLLSPAAGDCNDYAVTKRHQLLARGWPSRSLLLAEVATTRGEHHLVLVVRTGKGDVVLDNLVGEIVPWSRTDYRWVRVQSPDNPAYWSTVRPGDTPVHAATTSEGGA